MEYMSHGSLSEQLWKYKNELERQDTKHVLSPRILNKFLVDICNGMKEMEAKQVCSSDLEYSYICGTTHFTMLVVYSCNN